MQAMKDMETLKRIEKRMEDIRNKYDAHMDWSIEDRRERKQLGEQRELLLKKLEMPA